MNLVVLMVVETVVDIGVAAVVVASSSYAVGVPFDVVVEDNRLHYWTALNQIERQQ